MLNQPFIPQNQVEESFATQAAHDLLFLLSPTHAHPRQSLDGFDHLSFPGVVPRSFWGPLLLAAPARLVAPFLAGLADTK